MTQDPKPPAGVAEGADDALEATQPIEVPRYAPAPDPRPDTRWAWATPETRPAGSDWAPAATTAPVVPAAGAAEAAPGPEATVSSRPSWSAPASASTAGWPATRAAGPVLVVPAQPVKPARRRRSPGVGTIAVVALLSAAIASGGTVLALANSGALTPPTTVAPAATDTTAGLGATGGTAPGVVTDDSAAVISSSAKVSPSVVKITTSATTVDPFSSDQTDGVGSGIIYDASGWIITNHHVVASSQTVTVELKDGRNFKGTVYGIDTMTDLAIIKVEATGLAAAALGVSDDLKVGQLVVAVGSPLGTYSFSVTSGIVSGKGRSVTVSDTSSASGASTISNLIQTDAAINPGNSGGPLADATGKVVGINTAVVNANGIGFAIPIDIAKPIMNQAVRGEKLERPWIGIYFQPINAKVKEAKGLTVDDGALIINASGQGSAVQPGSPAEAAGLKDNDVITSINGIALDQEHPLNLLLVQFAPGDVVQLKVLRNGQALTIPVTLGVRPANLN